MTQRLRSGFQGVVGCILLLVLLYSGAHAAGVQLPQSGQTTVYSAGDDGDIRAGKAWPNPRFSDNGNQSVTDNLTGLIWASDANLIKKRDPGFDMDGAKWDGAVSWQHALDYIHKLNMEKYLGYSDWRLPNLNELASLVDQEEANASKWLNGQGFAGVQSQLYWTSSTNVMSADTAWTIGMSGGPVNYLIKDDVGYVWPVRGGESGEAVLSGVNLPKTGQVDCFDISGSKIACAGTGQDGELQIGTAWPQPRFIDNGDQTVTDNLTGLIWTRDANLALTRNSAQNAGGTNADGSVTWQAALDYVQKLNNDSYLGFGDWRLPNRLELASVMNYVETNPFAWLNWQGIYNVQDSYWSSGTVASVIGTAWNVTATGVVLGKSKSSGNSDSFVWPVRGPEITDTAGGSSLTASLASAQAAMAPAAPLSVTTTTLSDGVVGTAYSQTLSATGGTRPYSWSLTAGSLPAGLTLSSAGVISGAPTTTGGSSFTVQVKDKSRTTATKVLSITISAAPLSISTVSLSDGYLNSAYSQTLIATGGKAGYSWSITSGALPASLSLAASTGVLSGTPTASGASSVTIQVKDANNATVSKSFSMTVYTPPSISTANLPGGSVGIAYSQPLATAGGKSPYSWSIASGSLPSGVTLNTSTGVISGTPSKAATSNFTVQVKDANNVTASKSLTLVVYAALRISTSTLPAGTVGTTYNQILTATGGKTPYTWAVLNDYDYPIPRGLILDANTGAISGTPTSAVSSSVTFSVTDANNNSFSKSLTMTINPAPLTVGPLPDGYVNQYYRSSINTNGGVYPYTWSIFSGALPPGLALEITNGWGYISGTPTATGSSTFTIQVKDSNRQSVRQSVTLNISNDPPVIATSTLADGYDTVPYNQALTATGGNPPYGWSHISGNMPDGVSLNSSGTISGTPRGAGVSTFTVKVMDSNYGTATKTFSLTIGIAPLVITTSALANAYVAAPYIYSQKLAVHGGTPPYTSWSLSDGSLPVGLSLNSSTGVITGTPAATGISSFSIRVTDSNNNTADKTFSLVVKAGSMVSAISPLPNAIDVTYPNVSAIFGEPMNPSTVTNGSFTVSRQVKVSKVAAGDEYTLVLRDDGTLAAWGSNSYGQVIVPAGLTEVMSVSAGGAHSVVLKMDGTVISWGGNYSGQATIPSGLSGVVLVSAGGAHTVALQEDGTVVSWGDNSYGQTTVPSGLSGVISVSAGGSHTVALKNDGTVVAWGSNADGQSAVPSGLSGVVSVAAGGSHSLALKNDGTVVAWGSNADGQSAVPSGLSGVVSVAAGGSHSLALKSDGTVVAWGEDYSDSQITIPPGLSGVVAVSAGGLHDVALKSDGTIVAWALKRPSVTHDGMVDSWFYNEYGQATIPEELSGVKAVAAGGAHTLVLEANGRLFAWGAGFYNSMPVELTGVKAVYAGGGNNLALLENGTIYSWNSYGQLQVPSGISGVTGVSVGQEHTLALENNGTVVAWGNSDFGKTTVPAGLSGVVSVAAGGDGTAIFMQGVKGHSIAAKSDGAVVAWGYNGYGQTTVPAGLTGVVAVAAGGNHSVALKSDGTVIAWGYNVYGQTTVPVGLSGVVAVAAGLNHTVALKSDGTVVAWGSNADGQSAVPSGLSGVVSVAAGRSHSLALKNDGTVVAWGYKQSGQAILPSSPYESYLQGSVIWDPATLTATFVPDMPLPGEATIKASLSQGIKSQDGVSLPPGVDWSFTTAKVPPIIATSSFVDGYVGSAYNRTLAASNGKSPYTWSITNGNLPAGLSLNSASGAITGTPTAEGSSSFTIQVKDANNLTATKSLTIAVYSAPAITTTSLSGGYVGVSYTQMLASTGGKAPYAWSIVSGTLPADLSLSSQGVITGTPTAAVNSGFTVQMNDANNITATKPLTINISQNAPVARIRVTPSELSFGFVKTSQSGTGVVTVTNSSTTDLIIGTVVQPSEPFRITSDDCSGKALAASAFCSITVQFAPSQSGSISGSLSIPSDDENYPLVSVLLSGEAIFGYLLPDTGRNEYIRNPMGYSLSSDHTAVDVNTKLIWQRSDSGAAMTWAEADTYCRNLSLDGQTGWRLPNYVELSTIVHYGMTNPAIDQQVFTTAHADNYWTATLETVYINGNLLPYARAINFAYGEAQPIDKATVSYVRCVKGETLSNVGLTTWYPDSQTTISDENTGLLWMGAEISTSGLISCDPITYICTPADWNTVRNICSSVNYAGFGGWRLPTIKELATRPTGYDISATLSGKLDQSGYPTAFVYDSGKIISKPTSEILGDYLVRCVRGGSTTAVQNLGDIGNAAVMAMTGDFTATTVSPRQEIAKQYILTHGDTYDFLVFLSTFDYAMPEAGAKGFYREIKNDVQGINRTIFDYSAQYGSNGKLQGTIDLGNITTLASNPYGPKLEESVTTLNHELLHRFGAYVRYKDQNNQTSTVLIGKDNAHWSYLLDTKGSLMYGNGWRDNGNGTFISTAKESVYSPLDLYLMGMIPKELVPPMLLIDNPAIDKTQLPQLGATISGTAKTVTIDDIIAAEGARIPDSAASQKKYNVGFVLVTRPGGNATNAAAAVEILRNAWAGRFAELTQGTGGVNDVTPSLNVTIDSPADNSTITGPDVTVSGTIINSTGAETGITVNGMPATISGSKYIVNHVPLQTGENTITIAATDVNGLTATTTRSVTAQAGHYIRITSNIESGTAPLNVSLRLEGSFSITGQTISASGPVQPTLAQGATPTEYTAILPVEGTYTITASAQGPDSQTYSDSVTVTVVSRQALETLLKAKWEGMKSSIINGDFSSALTHFVPGVQSRFNAIFADPANEIPTRLTEVNRLEIFTIREHAAQAGAVKMEAGVEYAYPVIFVKDVYGFWKIYGF